MSESRILWGNGTTRTVRAHWALHELGLNYRNIPIRTRSSQMDDPAFRAVSQQKKIPVLQDGALTLSESGAIVCYLAEQYSSPRCQLIPRDMHARARYLQWLCYTSMELDATALYVLRRHEHLPHIYGESAVASDGAREYFQRMADALAAQMPTGGYLLPSGFSGADIVLASCLDWAIDYQLPLPQRLADYLELCRSRNAYKAAVAANRSTDLSACDYHPERDYAQP